ncbi:MAG: YfiR family protein [Steroidobacteraceae bacterium]
MTAWPAIAAADAPVLEYQVKAVFLLRLAQFTEWPRKPAQQPSDPFVMGVLGEDPFGSMLDQAVAGERVAGRPVVVRRFSRANGLATSDLLFVAGSHRAELGRVLPALAGAPTLTVSDVEGFVGQGGAVELFLDRGRVRFRIDREVAEAAGLSMSSQLLRAAVLAGED